MSATRLSRFPSAVLFLAIIFAAATIVAAPQKGETADWRVQLDANSLTGSTVTANNKCQQTHTFQIQPDHLAFMTLKESATFEVPAHSQHVVPVEFDTHHMKPGSYEALLTVRCMSCKSEPACTEDHQDLHVFVTVVPGAPNWSNVYPDEKGSAKNPALLWINISPDKKPHK